MDWKDTDAFYQSLGPEDQERFDWGDRNFGTSYAGEFRNCPTCQLKRITSCSVCGCGSCYTCGYRFICTGKGYPSDFSYTMPPEGNFTEEVELAMSDKVYNDSPRIAIVASGSYIPWKDLSFGIDFPIGSFKIGKF